MTQKHFAAITSERHRGVLETILPGDTLYHIDSNPNVRGKLAEWEDLNIDIVVIDDDGMPYKDVSENDLYTYPATAKRKMQIIFIPAPERQLNDLFLGKLVHVGIYDIVSPRLEGQQARERIVQMIQRPSILSDALSYFDEAAVPFNSGKIKKKHTGLIKKTFGRKETPSSNDNLLRDADEAGLVEGEATYNKEPEATPTLNSIQPGSQANQKDSDEHVAAPPQNSTRANMQDLLEPNDPQSSALEKLLQLGNKPSKGGASLTAGDITPITSANQQAEESDAETEKGPIDKNLMKEPHDPFEDIGSEIVSRSSPHETPRCEDQMASPDCLDRVLLTGDELETIADAVSEILAKRNQEESLKQVDITSATGKDETKMAAKEAKTKTVGFAEVCANSGATETALGLAFYIARRWPTRKVGVALTDRVKLNALLPAGSQMKGLENKGVAIAMIGDPILEQRDWLITDCGVLNYTVESKARSIFMTSELKCMCATAEPWRAPKIKELIEHYDLGDRLSWTWCFRNSPEPYVEKCLEVISSGKETAPTVYRTPYDPDYYYGTSEADYYELIRALLPRSRKAQARSL